MCDGYIDANATKSTARRKRAEEAKFILTVWWPAPSEKETYYDIERVIAATAGGISVVRRNDERLIISGIPFKLVEKPEGSCGR